MAVTVNPPQQFGPNSFLVSWASNLSAPTFFVYQDGRLINTTTVTQQAFTVEAGESLVVEVLDSASEVPMTAFPGRLTLGWAGVPLTKKYRIEEFVSSAWTLRAEINDSGQGFFKWQTRFLEDATIHQFRIIPVGLNGNNGTALTFSVLMVRHPDPPAQLFNYDPVTAKVTVS